MVEQIIDVMVQGGKATAGPPLGPALGPTGINTGQVVAEINKQTAEMKGMTVPVKVIINAESKTFRIEIGTPPTSGLLKKEAGVEKGAGKHKEQVAGNISIDSAIKIAKIKKDALLSKTLKSAVKEIIGTCNSLGLTVEGISAKEALKAIDSGRWAEKLSE